MMAARPIRFALSVESLERSDKTVEEQPLLEFDFAESSSVGSTAGPRRPQRRGAALKERIALWLERKL